MLLVFYNSSMQTIRSISASKKDQSTEESLRYKCIAKHYLNDYHQYEKRVALVSCGYCKHNRILVTGYSNGSFFLHELPDVTLIHSLK